MSVAWAETIIEQYRSPWGIPQLVAANVSDGSVWVASQFTVLHIDASGVLGQTDGFHLPQSIAVSARDGSCWVAEPNGRITKLSAQGEVLWRRGGYSDSVLIALDDGDGTAWVADDGPQDIVHLDADGTELLRSNWAVRFPRGPYQGGRFTAIAVDSVRGLCCVAGATGETAPAQGQALVLDRAGNEAPNTWYPAVATVYAALASDPSDGTIWGAGGSAVGKWAYQASSSPQATVYYAGSISVNPNDGSCWVASGYGLGTGYVTHVSADGQILWQGERDHDAVSIAVSPADNSVWVVEAVEGRLVHLREDGTRLGIDPGQQAKRVAVNPSDHSIWVGGGRRVSHQSRDGVELQSISPFADIESLAVNTADGSCWVADRSLGSVLDPDVRGLTHLAADGTEFPLSYHRVGNLSVNPADGSCWMAKWDGFTHIDAAGNLLWISPPQSELHGTPVAVAVYPEDGSCWYTTYASEHVGRYSADGTLLWQEDWLTGCLSVDPTDGSCWVGDGPAHLAADGAVLWSDTRYGLASISVNTSDGSAWGLDGGANRVLHWAADGTLQGRYDRIFGARPLMSFGVWQHLSVDSSDGSVWVADSGQIIHLVLRPSVTPTAAFEAWPLAGSAPLRVGFTDSSEGNVTSYLWDFGDGATSTAANPAHLYEKGGTYTVSLTASDGGGSDTATKAHYILVSFSDVPGGYWAAQQILACAAAGIVSGYPDGTYQPSASVTRDQMAVFLVRALGQEPSGPVTAQSWKDAYGYDPAEPTTWAVDFTDVPASGWGDPEGPYWAWYHIQRLYEIGVTQGVTATEYGPTQQVRRDQMAVFLIRALGEECANPCVDTTCWAYDPANPATWAHDFADIPATGQATCHGAHWAWYHIQALYETGVTLGCGDGTNYCPGDSVRRDEMAAFLARAFLGM